MGYTTMAGLTGNDREIERYAWFPVRTTSKKWIWLKKYYNIVNYLNTQSTRYPHRIKRLTDKEYTMYLITKPEPGRPNPPTPTSGIVPANIPRQKPLIRG